MNFVDLIIPVLILALLVTAWVKRVPALDSFVLGANDSFPLAIRLFAYVAAVFIAIELFRESGLQYLLANLLAPVLTPIGIPTELISLIIVKPFSGSGSLALLEDIYTQYGADSYAGRCASVIMGSNETVFYISAVYFAQTKVKKTAKIVLIALAVNFLSVILACLFCKL